VNDPFVLLKKDHREAEVLLERLADSSPGPRRKVTAGIKHHVKKEEHEMFPRLERSLARDEIPQLGDQVAAAKRAGISRQRAA
jgi:hemerythrin-like domain-containing protein